MVTSFSRAAQQKSPKKHPNAAGLDADAGRVDVGGAGGASASASAGFIASDCPGRLFWKGCFCGCSREFV